MESALEVIQYNEAKKLWNKFARHASTNQLTFELEVYKKLVDIFQAGEYYYYIFNLATAQIELVSDSAKDVLGLGSTNELTTEYVVGNIHPDDLPIFINFERAAGEFYNQLPPEKMYKYKVSYDYRLRKKNGEYLRMLHQVIPIQGDENGAIIRTLGVHTNISHVKKDTNMALSMIGLDGEPSYYNICTDKPGKAEAVQKFTKREQIILKQLLEGKTSQQIADHLCISKLTVDTHRRNMLQKTGAQSMAELTLKYVQGSLG
jgi:DNA-binding CsgD family transcriptional regulator